MVLAFLCHTVVSTPCRMLYSAVFGDDLQQASTIEGASYESLRSIRKDQLMHVACRVQTEFGFKLACRDADGSEGVTSDRGFLRLSPGDPFMTSKAVVWQAVDSCAYVMICELDENRLQAECVLALLVRLIQVHIVSGEQRSAEILLKGDKMTAILHLFLPNGHILFLNSKVVAQYEKQLEKLIGGK